jgi:hypothetical protein
MRLVPGTAACASTGPALITDRITAALMILNLVIFSTY